MKTLWQVQTLSVLEVASTNCTLSSQGKLKHKE